MGWACCIYGREEHFIQVWEGKWEKTDQLEDEGVYRRIILK
jgi:hypothetical protein